MKKTEVGGQTRSGGDLFIVENSNDDWKVCDYLREWTETSVSFDIATGFFEIGSLLTMDGHWQKLEKIRILMGDEVTARSRRILLATLVPKIAEKLDGSIESEKDKNDFLVGVPAIEQAIRDGRIELRVYAKDKFHAKTYITHAQKAVIGSSALVGSSNFTAPGLVQNIELNVQIRREVDLLQVRGTQWAAYNAVTAFEDYRQSSRPEDPSVQLNRVWFGCGADRKLAAFQAARSLVA